MKAARSEDAARDDVDQIRGDRQIQCDVLVALAECRNHRKWFAGFAEPFLQFDHHAGVYGGLPLSPSYPAGQVFVREEEK